MAADNARADLPVAVDTTGGDRGIDVQLEGAVLAFKEFGIRSVLVGPEEELRSRLSLIAGSDTPLDIVHASQTIGMEDSPTRAVRRKPDSSLCVAYNLVESGRASSIISAGNSGAMMAAGRIICGLLPGIERPAIATLLPVAGNHSPNVLLDCGANVDCHASNLVQFAIMGSIYCNSLLGIERPKVALLSNGSEPSKGTDVIRSAAATLSAIRSVNYIGYVEGRDIPTNMANVIVCDGFVGNVVLKTAEGCVRLIFEQLLADGKRNLLGKLGLYLSKRTYRKVFLEKFDYTAHGGAPLLGLRKLALVLHGSSDARAVKNAIRVADGFSKSGMTDRIAQELTQFDETLMSGGDDLSVEVLDKRNIFQNGKTRNPVLLDLKREGVRDDEEEMDAAHEAPSKR
ncbi:MAG: phosphate acyltransferase PlsX [Deltaproteobacteria bacterium]|nr:phosphate acyltransferase PlsX [Deltaproteobacteria bacterium]